MKINSRIGQFIIFLVAFIAVWNLCDLIASTLIYHESYVFSFADDIAKPAGLGTVIALILYILPGRKK